MSLLRTLPLLLLLVLTGCDGGPDLDGGEETTPPRPDARFESPAIPAFGPTPTPQQLAWQEMEVNAFIHFGVNTFTDREWGTGEEDPAIFNPTDLDARQWAKAALDGGIRGLILTAKHHDGFSLYPTRHSDHSVASSPWRDGQGDVVRELAEATREVGIEFGIYLSPWDMHEPSWGTAAYNGFYLGQLAELTHLHPDYGNGYGRLFELWLDGAVGPEVTQEQLNTYDWDTWTNEIRRNQPGAMIAYDHHLRWAGNERAEAPQTHWYDASGTWQAIECNTPFRPGWFWHADEDPKPLDELIDTYFHSVGRDCTLLLGLAPDTRGLLEDEDVERLREFKAEIDRLFAIDLAAEAPSTATSTRPGSPGWAAGAATDGDDASFWAAADEQATLETDLGVPLTASIVEIREPIWFGQRVAGWYVEAEVDGSWREVARGTTVGRRRFVRFLPTRAQRWRLVIEDARVAPAISQFSLYAD